ncbi:DUF3221 domain-containing protein, partial [Paenibacillus larvae]
TKKKLVAVATSLTLGLGFTGGVTPAFAHSDESSLKNTSISSVEKQEQLHFTGYVISINNHYLTVADVPTKEEALSYQNDWWELTYQNKILVVPVQNNEAYKVGDQLNVFSIGMTFSIPPIAVSPTIEKISE